MSNRLTFSNNPSSSSIVLYSFSPMWPSITIWKYLFLLLALKRSIYCQVLDDIMCCMICHLFKKINIFLFSNYGVQRKICLFTEEELAVLFSIDFFLFKWLSISKKVFRLRWYLSIHISRGIHLVRLFGKAQIKALSPRNYFFFFFRCNRCGKTQ